MREHLPIRRVVAALLCLPLALMFAIATALALLPPLDLARVAERSPLVLDREGRLLRPFVMADGRWRMPVSLSEVDPRYVDMLIAYEDRRFYAHRGVDLLAMARAAGQMLVNGRVVSGGSTLSMQVARLVEPREARSARAKVRQILRAVQLERAVGKTGILELYFALAPFGGNIEGIRAASLAYFGREPRRLSMPESALLVALPQSPGARRPDRFPEAATKARARVLERIATTGSLPDADLARGAEDPVPSARRPFPRHAAHRAETLLSENGTKRVIRTTLDRTVQSSLETLARERASTFGPEVSIAIVAVDLASGEVRASVGGPDYFNTERAGAMDLTRAIRSPGSALKPFVYALAFDEGIAHPETLLEDRASRFGLYTPENFDPGFQGLVTARHALQNSLNLPAVELLNTYGPQRFLARLRQAGADVRLPDASAPGLAIVLGGLGLSLHDLTGLFAGLGRGGAMLSIHDEPGKAIALGSIAGQVASWYAADILLGAPPPDNGPAGRIAFKTGTSYGYRDAFAVGFDRQHAIGVWVGRPDNAPVPGLVGRKSAAPILFEAFQRVGLKPGVMPRPVDALVARTSGLPPPLRHMRHDIPKTLLAAARQTLQIAYPPDGARLESDSLSRVDGTSQLTLKLQGGAPPFTVLMNGMPVHPGATRRIIDIAAPEAGFSDIAVIDRLGESRRISIRLD
ncbi:PbpC Membrane carboxypeptidase/penicillin-binding protein PbpC [Rhabdaerophilaceae bacterium]